MVAVHTPGADQHRAWQGNDRNCLVLTLRQGQVVAMRAFRDLDARSQLHQRGRPEVMRLQILHVPDCAGAEALDSLLGPLLAARPDIRRSAAGRDNRG